MYIYTIIIRTPWLFLPNLIQSVSFNFLCLAHFSYEATREPNYNMPQPNLSLRSYLNLMRLILESKVWLIEKCEWNIRLSNYLNCANWIRWLIVPHTTILFILIWTNLPLHIHIKRLGLSTIITTLSKSKS